MKRTLLLTVALGLAAPHFASSPVLAADGSLGVCADLSASPRDAAHHCRRALKSSRLSDKQRAGVQVNLGDALVSLGRLREALDAFDAALATGHQSVGAGVGRAAALEGLGRSADAASQWQRVTASAPESVDIHVRHGSFLLRQNSPAAAETAFSTALSLDPDDADARFNRGLARIALGRGQESAEDFTRVLQDYPNDAGAFYQRGRARAGLDDKAALEDFANAARLSPEWAKPWFLSGQTLDRLGRKGEADHAYRRAFELGYQDPWLVRRVQSLGG